MDDLNKVAEKSDDKDFINATSVAIKAKNQINERLGIQTIPVSRGIAIDPDVHYIVESIEVNEVKDELLELLEVTKSSKTPEALLSKLQSKNSCPKYITNIDI